LSAPGHYALLIRLFLYLYFAMNPVSNVNFRKPVRKFAYAIFLLLGIFTFSGFVPQARPEVARDQITLVVKSSARHSKRICYAKASIKCEITQTPCSSIVSLSLLHSQNVETFLATLNSINIPRRTLLAYHIKSHPDEPAII